MTEDQLRAIEARADDYNRYERCNELEVARKIIGRDIPALVAEVRRLRAQVDAMTELVKDLAKQQREEFHRLDYYEITTQELDRILNGESEGA